MRTIIVLLLSLTIQARSQDAGTQAQIRQEQISRAKTLELPTPYVPPPGDPLIHETAGYAKVVCSAVFITGFSAEFAAENLGYVISPYADRKKVGKPVVDRKKKTVSIDLPDGTKRTAKYMGSQGCVSLPPGRHSAYFKPERVTPPIPIAGWIFPRRRNAWPTNDFGDSICSDQRGGDHDDASEEAAWGTRSERYRANPRLVGYRLLIWASERIRAYAETVPKSCSRSLMLRCRLTGGDGGRFFSPCLCLTHGDFPTVM